MTLEERINQDISAAMKAKESTRLRGLRAIKAAILLVKTDGSGKPLDETREMQLLQKLVKQRRDSLEIYEKGGRQDLAQVEREEIDVISQYLPQPLSDEELEKIVRRIIAETAATAMSDMGKVMGLASKELAGKAEGKAISEVVKRLLSTRG